MKLTWNRPVDVFVSSRQMVSTVMTVATALADAMSCPVQLVVTQLMFRRL